MFSLLFFCLLLPCRLKWGAVFNDPYPSGVVVFRGSLLERDVTSAALQDEERQAAAVLCLSLLCLLHELWNNVT